MNILVSISCITYNHEKYITDAIESFLMQKTNFDFEILIHDDASTDRTPAIIEDYAMQYPDIIKPILQKENQQSKGIKRIGHVFNHARANGKYIAVCEGDDYWTDPYKLQKQVDYMENNPGCSICFHAAELINDSKYKTGIVKPYNENCVSPTEDIILGGGGFMATSSILYRKSIMDNAPDFYFNAPVGDYPLQFITAAKGYAYYIDEFMSVYRYGIQGSWTVNLLTGTNIKEKIITVRKQCIKMFADFNKYTDYKYNRQIRTNILRLKLQILVLRYFSKTYLKLKLKKIASGNIKYC